MAPKSDSSNSPTPSLLERIMRRHFERAFDETVSELTGSPLLDAGLRQLLQSLDEGAVATAREDLVQELFRVLPEHLKSEPLLAYFEGAIGMEQTLRSKMTSLPSAEFEAILHPVFKEDEWKLIAVGGALGVAIGCLQAFFLN